MSYTKAEIKELKQDLKQQKWDKAHGVMVNGRDEATRRIEYLKKEIKNYYNPLEETLFFAKNENIGLSKILSEPDIKS